jgi:hypothetical protein
MPKRVKDPVAVGNPDGSITVISPDSEFADDHPYVKANPNLFVEAWDEANVVRAPSRHSRAHQVEQATAAPGEKRSG